MAEVWTMGELLCEVMRPKVDMPLDKTGQFLGPFPSGAPAICIDTVARLGHSAGIIGCVGDDAFGSCLIDRLTDDGVDCTHIGVSPTGSTGVAFVAYAGDGSRTFLYHFANTPAVEAKSPDLGDFTDVKFFHIMGCSLMASADFGAEIVKTMRGLVAKGAKVSFDPNVRTELMSGPEVAALIDDVMECCSVLLPGEAELLAISRQPTIAAAVAKCFENDTLEVIVVKRGSRGCTVFTRDQEASFGVYPVEVQDATGAGDSFDGAFLCGLLDGRPLAEIVKMATAAAALNTAAFGPMEGDISPETLRAMMASPLSQPE